jgi:hypothetical protein
MTVYVGMDVHRKRSQVAIVDDAGVPQRNRNLANDPAKPVPVLGAPPPGTPVAFEAAYGWSWLVDEARGTWAQLEIFMSQWRGHRAAPGGSGALHPHGQPDGAPGG